MKEVDLETAEKQRKYSQPGSSIPVGKFSNFFPVNSIKMPVPSRSNAPEKHRQNFLPK